MRTLDRNGALRPHTSAPASKSDRAVAMPLPEAKMTIVGNLR